MTLGVSDHVHPPEISFIPTISHRHSSIAHIESLVFFKWSLSVLLCIKRKEFVDSSERWFGFSREVFKLCQHHHVEWLDS